MAAQGVGIRAQRVGTQPGDERAMLLLREERARGWAHQVERKLVSLWLDEATAVDQLRSFEPALRALHAHLAAGEVLDMVERKAMDGVAFGHGARSGKSEDDVASGRSGSQGGSAGRRSLVLCDTAYVTARHIHAQAGDNHLTTPGAVDVVP